MSNLSDAWSRVSYFYSQKCFWPSLRMRGRNSIVRYNRCLHIHYASFRGELQSIRQEIPQHLLESGLVSVDGDALQQSVGLVPGIRMLQDNFLLYCLIYEDMFYNIGLIMGYSNN